MANARFPVANSQVQITTTTAASDIVQNGVLLENTFASVRGAGSGGTQTQSGLKLTPTSQVLYVDATAGLPAGTQWVNGLPIAPTGELCISSAPVFTWRDAIPFAANGAVAASGAGPLPLSPALTNFRTGGTYGKKIIFIGDSTTSAPSPPWADITSKMGVYNVPGGQLDNIFMVNAGEIGVTFANVMNGTSVFNINWLTAQTFDVVVCCLGINDVRDGSTNAAGISTMLTNFVNAVHAARPNANIVLWTPNSFLSNDPTASGYITPNISFAQQYTDALWNGYNNVVGTWPTYVAHVDKQQIYGRTCKPGPTSLMQDVIHPDTVTGYTASALALANVLIPRGWPFNVAQAKDPFLVETVLGLNGDSLLDYRGKHVVTLSPAGVTASGGWLNLNGVGGLKINDVLTDFQFGSWAAGAGDAKVTIELQINSPVVAMPNGQVWFCNNNNLQIGNGSSYKMNVGNFGSTELGNAVVVTGIVINYAWEFGNGLYSEYLNGVRQFSPVFADVNFNTAGGSLYLFQEQTGWAAVVAQGQARVRVTRECRYNHAPSYTPYPGMWPTT